MPSSDALGCDGGTRTKDERPSRDFPSELSRFFPGAPKQAATAARFAGVAPFCFPFKGITVDPLIEGITKHLDAAAALGLSGIALGLSGGVDSVVCAELCRRAAGEGQVTAVTVLVGAQTERSHLTSLSRSADIIGIPHVVVDGAPLQQAMEAAWPKKGLWSPINMETRTVQTLIFQVADSQASSVCATTDRSEAVLGRYTEAYYGHVSPLLGLYKTQVLELAAYLGVMAAVSDTRPGCEGHWYDDEVLGADYQTIDPIVHLLTTGGLSPRQICREFGPLDEDWVTRIQDRIRLQPIRLGSGSDVLENCKTS